MAHPLSRSVTSITLVWSPHSARNWALPHDRCLAPKTLPFKVSHGEALVAMIVNGLGFHSSTLHMFPQFFAKPVERLIGPGICADDLNDDVLGRCLDALFEADVSALYQVMAAQVVERLGLKAPQCTSILPASTSMAP